MQEFLARNAYPHQVLDPRKDRDAQALIKHYPCKSEELPLVVCPSGAILKNPSEADLARALGMVPPDLERRQYDVAIASSCIENYLGFPTGISGQALTGRAYVQAQKFGADMIIPEAVTKLHCDGHPFAIGLCDGRSVSAPSVVIASGARYRRPGIFPGTNLCYWIFELPAASLTPRGKFLRRRGAAAASKD